jgi:uncharacterized protein (TIGR03437 family)
VQNATVLEVEIRNGVAYWDDVTDRPLLATAPGMVSPAGRAFMRWVFIGDVVEVNGRAAKGSAVFQGTQLNLTPTARPGQTLADIARSALSEFRFEIQQADGTPVGSIMGFGINGGSPPPGPIRTGSANNNAVIGGTGAFLGARGQQLAITAVAARQASMAEDPANRRTHGGGAFRAVLYLIPLWQPEVVMTRDGPAVVHSNDFSPVNPSKPARRGEILSLVATGLGPTRPGVELGTPFTADPLQVVNSPVEVTVNGSPAEVMAATGYPNSMDGYQVNFRIPPDTARGQAKIQLTVAWIRGAAVTIPVE